MPERMGTGVVGSVPPASVSAAGTQSAAHFKTGKDMNTALDVARGSYNVALGRPYTATAGYAAYTDVCSLNDGIPVTRLYGALPADIGWYSDSPHSDTWVCDLGSVCIVSRARQYSGHTANGGGVQLPTVTVAVSPDGVSWRDVAVSPTHPLNPAANEPQWIEQSWPPCPARFVRLTCANLAAVWTMFGEIEVHGFPCATQEGANLVFSGDSMVAAPNWPTLFTAGMMTGCAAANVGVGAKTLAQLIIDDVVNVDGLLSGTQQNTCIIWAGGNDLYFGATPAQAEQSHVTYCAARKAAGWGRVLVGTILPRSIEGTPVGFEADRLAVNTWLRAHWSEIADGLMDFAADTRIGDAGDETDANYYSDLCHLTAQGQAIVAAIALAAYWGA